MTLYLIDGYLYAQLGVWENTIIKRKLHPSQVNDASTASAAVDSVGRGEQGQPCPAISAPRGGPHLDIGCLRFKTCSKSDLPIAGTTWPTFLCMYLYPFGVLLLPPSLLLLLCVLLYCCCCCISSGVGYCCCSSSCAGWPNLVLVHLI